MKTFLQVLATVSLVATAPGLYEGQWEKVQAYALIGCVYAILAISENR